MSLPKGLLKEGEEILCRQGEGLVKSGLGADLAMDVSKHEISLHLNNKVILSVEHGVTLGLLKLIYSSDSKFEGILQGVRSRHTSDPSAVSTVILSEDRILDGDEYDLIIQENMDVSLLNDKSSCSISPLTACISTAIVINNNNDKNGTKKKGQFVCEYCHLPFISKAKFQRHRRIHTEEKPYVCVYCKETFSHHLDLRKHRDAHHIFDKPFKCSYCPKTFSTKAELRGHMWRHTGEKNHKCRICAKTFATKGNLKLHVDKHTGVLKHKCSFCFQKFTSHSSLEAHMAKHTGLKSYKCRYCTKSYAQAGQLTSHERLHTGEKPFVCEVCSKGFRLNSTRLAHEKRHSGARPHMCDTCGRSFAMPDHLRRHMKTHENKLDKLVACPFCKKKIFQGRNMRKHLFRHRELSLTEIQAKIIAASLKPELQENLTSQSEDRQISQSKKRLFQCQHCNEEYMTIRKLFKHLSEIHYQRELTSLERKKIRMHYGVQKIHRCQLCKASFMDVRVFRSHILSEHPVPSASNGFISGMPGQGNYKCQNCPSKFSTKSSMDEHMKKEHLSLDTSTSESSQVLQFHCWYCNDSFVTPEEVVGHMTNQHESLDVLSKRVEKSVVSDTSASSSDLWTCHHCSSNFKTESEYNTHITSHAKTIDMSIINADFNISVEKDGKDICKHQTDNSNEYIMHSQPDFDKGIIDSSTVDDILTCQHCSLQFKSEKMYKSHVSFHACIKTKSVLPELISRDSKGSELCSSKHYEVNVINGLADRPSSTGNHLYRDSRKDPYSPKQVSDCHSNIESQNEYDAHKLLHMRANHFTGKESDFYAAIGKGCENNDSLMDDVSSDRKAWSDSSLNENMKIYTTSKATVISSINNETKSGNLSGSPLLVTSVLENTCESTEQSPGSTSNKYLHNSMTNSSSMFMQRISPETGIPRSSLLEEKTFNSSSIFENNIESGTPLDNSCDKIKFKRFLLNKKIIHKHNFSAEETAVNVVSTGNTPKMSKPTTNKPDVSVTSSHAGIIERTKTRKPKTKEKFNLKELNLIIPKLKCGTFSNKRDTILNTEHFKSYPDLFKDKADLKDHINVSHKNQDPDKIPFHCWYCDLTFMTPEDVVLHMTRNHDNLDNLSRCIEAPDKKQQMESIVEPIFNDVKSKQTKEELKEVNVTSLERDLDSVIMNNYSGAPHLEKQAVGVEANLSKKVGNNIIELKKNLVARAATNHPKSLKIEDKCLTPMNMLHCVTCSEKMESKEAYELHKILVHEHMSYSDTKHLLKIENKEYNRKVPINSSSLKNTDESISDPMCIDDSSEIDFSTTSFEMERSSILPPVTYPKKCSPTTLEIERKPIKSNGILDTSISLDSSFEKCREKNHSKKEKDISGTVEKEKEKEKLDKQKCRLDKFFVSCNVLKSYELNGKKSSKNTSQKLVLENKYKKNMNLNCCFHCSRTFCTKRALDVHTFKMHGQKYQKNKALSTISFKCWFCSSQFISPEEVVEHMTSAHENLDSLSKRVEDQCVHLSKTSNISQSKLMESTILNSGNNITKYETITPQKKINPSQGEQKHLLPRASQKRPILKQNAIAPFGKFSHIPQIGGENSQPPPGFKMSFALAYVPVYVPDQNAKVLTRMKQQ